MTARLKTAMVLAAGLGTRMRPLTSDRPKPLVEVLGQTLIDRVLDRLAAGGIERAVVNVHYRADQLIDHLKRRTNPAIVISDEQEALLDTGGGVTRALRNGLLGPEPFLINNSDSIWVEGVESNIARLAQNWNPDVMDSLMLLALSTTSLGYDGRGDFTLGADGRVTRRAEHAVTPFVFTGVSIARPELFESAPDGPFSLKPVCGIDRSRNGRLYGIRLEGRWMHVGTPAGLAEAEAALMAAEHDEDD